MGTLAAAPPSRFNFAGHLFERNAGRAAKPAYIDDVQTLTYGGLADRAVRMSSALAQLDLRREERLFVCLHDSVDYPVTFLGALHAGVVPVCVNTLLTVDDYAYMLANSRARALVVSGALMPTLQQALERGAHEIRQVIVSRPASPLPSASGVHDFDALLAAQTGAATAPTETGADDIAFWLYSSGSTGRPKGTVHTHANLYWTAEALWPARARRSRGRPRILGGEALLRLRTRQCADLSVVGRRNDPPHGGTADAAIGVQAPGRAQADDLLRGAHALRRDAGGARAPEAERGIACAGALRPESRCRRTSASASRRASAATCWTASVRPRCCTSSSRIFPARFVTAPRASRCPATTSNCEARAGNPVADGEIGDLYIRGPSAALMYWGNREQSRATFQGEWTKSGDKYVRGSDGYYTYAGRSDDMLKVGGPVRVAFRGRGRADAP